MTVREAMNIINGALDSLYEFYDNDADSMFEEISAAEEVLEKLVQKEESKPEEYWAVCPNCGQELYYDTFEYDALQRTLTLLKNKDIEHLTEADMYEAAQHLLQENAHLQASNRNWRRKCQRLRHKLKEARINELPQ